MYRGALVSGFVNSLVYFNKCKRIILKLLDRLFLKFEILEMNRRFMTFEFQDYCNL